MIETFIVEQIKSNFHHIPTDDQEYALQNLALFLKDSNTQSAFILRGYAGTGKTTLISALVQTMDALKQKSVLMAPTGRAAKVLSLYSGHPAFTIHKRIYRQKKFTGELDNFQLNSNLATHTLFIVDEASMISNTFGGSMFGSGKLLDDLLEFVYSGEGCRLLLMGDTAQLPPVGEEMGVALSNSVLSCYGLKVYESDLKQVVRQLDKSGILYNATSLRRAIDADNCLAYPKLKANPFKDVIPVTGGDLIESISDCYSASGQDQTVVITRSNKRAHVYNMGIRNTILYYEDELCPGDALMVAKNNYYWMQGNSDVEFIANGDQCEVKRVHNERKLYGFRFADATLCFHDYNDVEVDATILLDTLHAESPALTESQSKKLYENIMEEYADISSKAKRLKELRENPYYNALQIKYGYAVTCHKAQGGQWKNVFLDQGYVDDKNISPDFYHWLYTAFTRATEKLYLVNFPTKNLE